MTEQDLAALDAAEREWSCPKSLKRSPMVLRDKLDALARPLISPLLDAHRRQAARIAELEAVLAAAQAERDQFKTWLENTQKASELEVLDVWKRFREAEAQRDKLQAFKDWVHAYLDAHGILTHPDGPHSKEGCRIGDRMDLLVDQRDAAQAERDRLQELNKEVLCAFCGRAFLRPDTPEKACEMMAAHIVGCEKHPMRAAVAAMEAAQADAADWKERASRCTCGVFSDGK